MQTFKQLINILSTKKLLTIIVRLQSYKRSGSSWAIIPQRQFLIRSRKRGFGLLWGIVHACTKVIIKIEGYISRFM